VSANLQRAPRACRATAEEVAALIRRTREERGLTQYELAKRMGSAQSTVARWESGEHDFEMKTVARIAAALGVELVVHFGPQEMDA
jgi:UDP-N-acetylglucosamine 1-carboxyvinyltransferase